MAYKYGSGLEILKDLSEASNTFMYLSSGIIIDTDTGENITKYDIKLKKYSGKNYIYADENGDLYSSPFKSSDSLIKIVYMDEEITFISEEFEDPDASLKNQLDSLEFKSSVSGDMLIHDGTAFRRFPKGEENQILAIRDGNVVWDSPRL